MADRDRVRLPVIARPRVLVAFVVVVVLVGAAGVLLGASLRSADGLDEAASEAPPTVEVDVERRSISPPTLVQGVVDAGDTATVAYAGVAAPAVLPYVTEVGTGAGAALENGRLLAAVAGRPLVALRVTAPLYRDLHVGDTGADVQAFETALNAAVGGDFDVDETFTALTLAAAEQLWDDLGYELPTTSVSTVPLQAPAPTSSAAPQTSSSPGSSPSAAPAATTEAYVDVTQIVQLTTDSVSVLNVLAVGATASADTPLATLQTSPRRIVARVTVLDAEAFAPGTPVVLQTDGRPELTATVARLGDFAAAEGGDQTVSGRDVFVDLPSEWSDLVERATVVLSTVAAGDAVLAVPLSAVHDASTEPFVVIGSSTRFEPREEVAVTVLGSGDGWVRIDEQSGLAEGDSVVVSP